MWHNEDQNAVLAKAKICIDWWKYNFFGENSEIT